MTRGDGVVVENLRTHYGRLNFTMRGEESCVRVVISGDARPPAGFVARSPFDNSEGAIRTLPAEITFRR